VTAPTQAPQRQLSAADVAALIALVEAQAAVRAQLTRTAVIATLTAFRALSLADWWNPTKVNGAVDSALRVVQASQRQAARITDAYLARAATLMTGRTVRTAGIIDVATLRRAMPDQVIRDLAEGKATPAYLILGEHDPDRRRVVPADTINAAYRGVVPDPNETVIQRIRRLRAEAEAQARTVTEVEQEARREAQQAKAADPKDPYGRVADSYRYQVVAKGATQEKARANALVRVAAVAETDVTMAVREQVRRSVGRIPGITGYRRVLRPELSETGPCGLCVVAATRRYNIEDLQPIHDNCVCEVLPIIGEMDPGLELNRSDLERIYEAAGGTGGEVIKAGRRHSAALKKLRVALVEHGELGPVLVDADQTFRGPRKVAEMKHPDVGVRRRAQLAALEDSFAKLTRRRLAGEDVDRAITWQENKIRELQRELQRTG
jgi:hypothetical protein